MGSMESKLDGSSNSPCDKIILSEKRGPPAFSRRQIARHPLRFLRIISPFLTAHHPFCSEFDDHVIVIGNRRWCLGCFFNTVFFTASMTGLFGLWVINPGLLNRQMLFFTGAGGTVVYLLSSGLGFRRDKKLKVFSKLILSSSFAFVTWSILIANGPLLSGIESKLLLVFLLYLFVVTGLNIKRIVELRKTCDACDYKVRWSRCPGFKDTVCRLLEEGFVRPRPTGKESTTDRELTSSNAEQRSHSE